MYFIYLALIAVGLHFEMKRQYPLKEGWDSKKKNYHRVIYFCIFPVLFAPMLLGILLGMLSRLLNSF